MPQLDFRQAFASPSDVAPTVAAAIPHSASEEVAILRQKRTLATRLPRLHRSDRTTILFAILIFVGGLFCAFYFFNGAELLRAAAAWSREFLYPRPAALIAENNDKSTAPNSVPDAQTPSVEPRKKSNPARGNDTAPFSRNLGSLYPDTNGGGNAGSLSGTSSPLGQLTLPAPGGDALMQAFNQGVENIGRMASLYANGAVTVIQAPAAQASRNASAQVNNLQQTAAQTAGSQTAAAQQAVQNAQQRATRAVNASQIRGATSIIGGKDLQQGLSGTGLGGLGGLGDAGAAGGAGGMAGSAAGALGGALGGAGLGN